MMRKALTRTVLTTALCAALPAVTLAADLMGTVRVRRDQRLDALARVTVIAQAADGSEVLASTKTDGEGKFVFRNLPSPRVALTAQRAGFYTYSAGGHADRQIVLDCSTQQDCLGVDFEMRQGAVITGRVVDELGEPVQSIQVHAEAADEDKSSRERRRGWSMSDDRGMFRVAGLDPGNYVLRTEFRRRQGPERELPAASMNIAVGDGEDLRGIELVLREPTAEPVETYRVSGRVTGVDLSAAEVRYLSARARSGGNTRVADDGSFELSLEPGNYRFRYFAQPRAGGRGIGQSISLGSATITGDIADLVLSPMAATGLEGRVVIESGEPYDAMTLWLTGVDVPAGESLSVEAPDYAFHREGLEPGDYHVRLRRRFLGENRLFLKEVRVEGKRSESATLRLTSGILKDVEIVLSGDGRFALYGLAAKSLFIEAISRRGRDFAFARAEIHPSESRVEEVELLIQPSITVSGKVVLVDPPEKPAQPQVEGTGQRQRPPMLWFRGVSAVRSLRPRRTPMPLDGGSFEMEGIQPREYRVRADAPEGSYLKTLARSGRAVEGLTVTVPSDGTITDLELHFAFDGATVSGSVTSPDSDSDVSIDGAQIVMIPDDPEQYAGQTTVAVPDDGSFEILNLPPGGYTFFAVSARSALDPWDPDVRKALRASGKHVQLDSKEKATVELTVIPEPDEPL